MPVLTREALLGAAATTLPRTVLHIPELGGDVILQGMSGTDRDAWEQSLVRGRGKKRDVNLQNVRAKLVVRSLINEDGSRMFTDAEAPAVGAIRVDVLNQLFEAAQKLSGVSDEDVDELGKSSESTAG